MILFLFQISKQNFFNNDALLFTITVFCFCSFCKTVVKDHKNSYYVLFYVSCYLIILLFLFSFYFPGLYTFLLMAKWQFSCFAFCPQSKHYVAVSVQLLLLQFFFPILLISHQQINIYHLGLGRPNPELAQIHLTYFPIHFTVLSG